VRALVVHGEDGLDELSLTGPSWVAELSDGVVRLGRVEPGDAGLSPCAPADLAGGDAAHNAAIVRAVLDGHGSSAQRDIALLNAGAALWIGGVADGLAAGVERARDAVHSGAARRTLESLIELTNR
jgi:anthranilate phosphoribosyltransferase